MADELKIIISAKDDFSRVFKNLEGTMPLFAAGAVAAFATAAAAALSFTGSLVSMTVGIAEAHAKIFDMSQQLGLSTEFISKMQYAASLTGVDMEKLNMSMKKLQIGIGEASMGTGEAKKAFDMLGISVRDASGNVKTAEEIFPEIIEAFENIGSSSQKAALAAQIFGARSTEILQIMAEGKAGFKAMGEEAEKMGVSIGDKAARNADALDDALVKLKTSVSGVKAGIAQELMPVLTYLSTSMMEFIVENRTAIIEFAKTALEKMVTFFEFCGYGVAVLIDSWRGLNMIWETLKIGFYSLAETITRGLLALTEKVILFMQATNIGGVFDNALVKARNFYASAATAQAEFGEKASESWGKLNTIIDQGLAGDKVTKYADNVRTILAGIQLPEQEEKEPKGIPPFTDDNTNKMGANADKAKEISAASIQAINDQWAQYYLTETERVDLWYADQQRKLAGHTEALLKLSEVYNMKKFEADFAAQIAAQEQLRALHEEWTLTEMERLDSWYAVEQEKFQANEEALTMLKEIYAAKRTKIEESEKKKQKDLDQKDMLWKKEYQDGLTAVLAAGAGESATIAKAKAIFDTILATHSGAIKAYEALAWIPLVGPALGSAAAAAVIAFGMARLGTIKSQTYAAHGGMTYVPKESTYLLDRGERVLSPRQNEDLGEFMEGGGQGVNVGNVNIHVFENATNVNALKDMDRRDWEDIAAEKIIPAFKVLATQGIKT